MDYKEIGQIEILDWVQNIYDSRGKHTTGSWYPNCSMNKNLSHFLLIWLSDVCIWLLHPEDKKRVGFFSGNHQDYNFSACAVATDRDSYQHVSDFSCLFYVRGLFFFFLLSPSKLRAECKFGGSLLHNAFSFQSRNCLSEIIFKMYLEERDVCLQAEISKIIFWKRALLV